MWILYCYDFSNIIGRRSTKACFIRIEVISFNLSLINSLHFFIILYKYTLLKICLEKVASDISNK